MTLTAVQQANTTAGAFDVRLRYYADGAAYNTRTDLSDYTADGIPAGWTVVGDTVTPAGDWEDVTDLIAHEGQFVQEVGGGALTWQAQVRGYEYDADLFAAGKSLLCLRRYENYTGGGAELLTNGGFESYTGTPDDGVTDTFSGWGQYTGAGEQIEATATAHAGSAAVKLTSGSSPPTLYMLRDVTVPANRVLCFSAWLRGNGEDGQPSVELYDNAHNLLATLYGTTADTWQYVSVVIAPPAADTTLHVSVRLASIGVGYVDGLSLCEVGANWHLWYLGALDAGGWRDDYRHGAAWQRTVRSAEATLQLTDAPRLTIGRLRLEEGASVRASSTLATPAAEAGNGEFVGSTANVQAANVVDGRVGTVWISQDPPTTTAEEQAAWSGLVVDEVFWRPLPGFSAATAWWVEILNNNPTSLELGSKDNLRTRYALYTRNTSGESVVVPLVADGATGLTLGSGERLVLCADQAVFEALTGGARNARYVIEVKSKPGYLANAADGAATATAAGCDLHPTDGWVAIGTSWDDIAWGSYWDVVRYGSPTLPTFLGSGWSGAGVGLTALQDGQSIRRAPPGTDTDTSADWKIEAYPRPGDKWAPNTPQWLQTEVRAHETTLAADTLAGAATLTFTEGATGWPPAGAGVCEGDTFDYTGRTATGLTGVTGLTSAHANGAQVYPTDATSAAQTGWRCEQATVVRLPGLSKIRRARLYTSAQAAGRTPEDTGWESDYNGLVVTLDNGTTADNALSTLTRRLGPTMGDGIWLRTLLLLIDEMWDGGRAKINEITVEIDQADVNASGVGDIAPATTAAVVQYLIAQHTWLADGALVSDETPTGWGAVGGLATGVAPVPQVLADLARGTGCVIVWTRDGKLCVQADPWWPGGAVDPAEGLLDEGEIRGEVRLMDGPPGVNGVAVSALDAQGNVLQRVVVPPGASGSGVQEHTGLVVADAGYSVPLAWNLYWQAASNREMPGLTLKGIGEWCQPGQRVLVNWNDIAYGQWIIERVTQSWRNNAGQRDWRTTLDLRKFFAG